MPRLARIMVAMATLVLWIARDQTPLASAPSGRQPKNQTIGVQLGTDKNAVTLHVTHHPPARRVGFVLIHDDEATAEFVVKAHVKRYGGKLVNLDTKKRTHIDGEIRGTRLVSFDTATVKNVTVDPNRIFTQAGVQASLKKYHGKRGNYQQTLRYVGEIHELGQKITSNRSGG